MTKETSANYFGSEVQADWIQTQLPLSCRLLRSFIRAGFSRGKVKKLVRKLWYLSCGDSPVDTEVRGAKYRLDFRDNAPAQKIFFSSRYDTKELECLHEASQSGGVFVDIGANIGYYSIDLASNGIDVIAIEPNPIVFSRLLFNISINNLNSRIKAEEICVAEPGLHTLSFKGHGTGSLIALHGPGNELQVKGDSLLNILRQHKVEKVASLKIDIEGTEDQALVPFFDNAPQSLWPACMVIEHSNRKIWKTDLISYLLEKGYKIALKKHANTVLMLDR